MSIKFTLNDKTIALDDTDISRVSGMPLLWFLREMKGLKGTKFGCGIGQCGACTVHLNGQAVRSCTLMMDQLDGAAITTIEGLADADGNLHPVQEAWMEVDVPQCGYCQAGQIMAATSLLQENPNPSDEYINEHLTNICRCGTYTRIRNAIKIASEKIQTS